MPEITVASTTDTQEHINEVAGLSPGEVEAEGENPEGADIPESPDGQRDSGTPEKKESKSGVQKRIDKLTREKYEFKEKFEELSGRLAKLETGKPVAAVEEKPKEAAPKKDEGTPRPKEADFQDFETYQDAVNDWRVEEKLRKLQAEAEQLRAKQTAAEAERQLISTFHERLAEAEERYDDFSSVVSRDMAIPEVVGRAIVEMDNGPDVMYYLGKHPEVAKELMEMTPTSALTRLGKIAAALEPAEPEADTGALTPKIKSRAGEPIKPVSSSSTKSTVPIDELPFQEYRKIRDRQEKDRWRR